MLSRLFTRTGEDGEIIEQYMQDVSWEEVRAHRNAALMSSDWRALKDVTLPNPWKEYRQALRDLPQNHDDANSACDAWPQPPE
jgi:hypothetical protein